MRLTDFKTCSLLTLCTLVGFGSALGCGAESTSIFMSDTDGSADGDNEKKKKKKKNNDDDGDGDDGSEAGSTTDDGGVETGSTGDATTGPPADVQVAPNGFYVDGNTIYDINGNPVLFHGVNRPALEWSAVGENMMTEADYIVMAQNWGANLVRLPLNQVYWLTNDSNYQARVAENVAWAKAHGMAVILDLHWTTTGGGQPCMADAQSLEFWTSVATAYAGDGQVMFELFNEPRDISWTEWKVGGTPYCTPHDNFPGGNTPIVGYQDLYNAVRATGAHNIVIVGGLDWAYDLSQVPIQRIDGYNIAYATHPYAIGGVKSDPARFPGAFGSAAASVPVIATEFGTFDCSTPYVQEFLNFAAANNISWTAWAWYVPYGGQQALCEFPSIISSWDGTPTAVGGVVQAAM